MYVPEQLKSSYETMHRLLDLSEREIFNSDDFSPERPPSKYNYAFWQRLFREIYPESSLKGLRYAYFKACLGAWELDRWKRKLESYPAWVRRLPEVRHIDAHIQKIMAQARKGQHRREAVGLALARMETVERKVKKCRRINLLIVGEGRILGNRAWCEQLEDMLPKSVRYRFGYSYFSLLRGSALFKQLFWETADFKPILYTYRRGFWTVKTTVGFDGIIWVGDINEMPKTNKPYVLCGENLSKKDRQNIMHMYKELREKTLEKH